MTSKDQIMMSLTAAAYTIHLLHPGLMTYNPSFPFTRMHADMDSPVTIAFGIPLPFEQ